MRYITSAATNKADGAWTVLEGFWTSGSLDGVLAGLTNGTGYDVQVRAVAATEGAWSATATGTPAEHGGTLQTAATLPPETRMGGVIESGTDVDFFKLDLTAATGIIIFTRGDLDTVGQLLDENGDLLSENDEGDELHGRHNFLLWGSLQAGTYYVKVTGSGSATGAYVLETTTMADTTQRSDAQVIEVGGFARGIIDPERTDEDWFRITVTGHTILLVHTTGPARTWGDLWQSRDRRAVNTDDFPLGGGRFFVRANLSPGTYYVEVGGSGDATGAYTLHVNRAAEPGSSIAAAQTLVPLFPKAGTISPSNDVDYFRIELAQATHVLLVAAGSAVPIAGELLDADGNPVDANITESKWLASAPPRVHAPRPPRGGDALPQGHAPARQFRARRQGGTGCACTRTTSTANSSTGARRSPHPWPIPSATPSPGASGTWTTPGSWAGRRARTSTSGRCGRPATWGRAQPWRWSDNGFDVGHPDLAPQRDCGPQLRLRRRSRVQPREYPRHRRRRPHRRAGQRHRRSGDRAPRPDLRLQHHRRLQPCLCGGRDDAGEWRPRPSATTAGR